MSNPGCTAMLQAMKTMTLRSDVLTIRAFLDKMNHRIFISRQDAVGVVLSSERR